MTILSPQPVTHTYKLIDSGNANRLEQFGNQLIVRPDTTCIWQPQNKKIWSHADLVCTKNQGGNYNWQKQNTKSIQNWTYTYTHPKLRPVVFSLRTNEQSKNIGIFPEQAAHWDWLGTHLQNQSTQQNILNLFAYTGGATIVAASAGAAVCHVDASKTTVTWASQNAQLNGLQEAPIRWVVEDCLVFMEREIKRGKKYDGIIMDPPAFGRDPKGHTFTFDHAIIPLLKTAQQLLSAQGFLLLNVYSVPLYSTHLANVVQDFFPQKSIESGELHLKKEGNEKYPVPCNIFVKVI